MLFLPFTILGMWLRGLVAVAVLALGTFLLVEWYRSLPAQVVVVHDEPPAPREETVTLSPAQRVVTWRPAFDRTTAFLAGGVLLLLAAFAGKAVTGLFLGGRGGTEEPFTQRGGEVQRLRRPDGTELHVETYGPAGAPAVILTHGWGVDSTEWYYLKERLVGPYRLLVWDLPGQGLSSRAGGGDYSVERLAHDLHAVLGLAGGPAALVGHSIGGMATLTHCRLYPQALGREVAGLVLAHTTYTNPVRTARRATLYTALQKPLIEPLLHLTVWLSPLVWLMNCLSYLNGSAHRSARRQSFAGTQTRGQLDYLARFSVKLSPAVLAKGMLGMLRYDATGVLGSVGVPVLVVAGDRDPQTTPEAARVMAGAMPAARLTTLSPARHQGHFERHGEFAGAVEDFLGEAFRATTGGTSHAPGQVAARGA
jgi:pimeloyl-ACP methyl ester carboxylesterase